MRSSFYSGLRDSGLNTVPQNIPFELGKNGQHPGECTAAGRCQVKSLTQRYEADLERR